MSGTAASSTNPQLPISDLAIAITYSGTLVSTMTVVYRTITYIKTFTNNGTNITNISVWVAQS